MSPTTSANDPLRPWQELLKHPDSPIRSRMSLDRYQKRGLIEVTTISGRHYLRVQQTLRRLGIKPADGEHAEVAA